MKGQPIVAENFSVKSITPPLTISNELPNVMLDTPPIEKPSKEADDLIVVSEESSTLVPEFLKKEVDELSVIRDNSPPVEKSLVGRQVIKTDGVYVEGSVQGTNMTFTADTGAAKTVISVKAFHKIPVSRRPELSKSNTLASANGQPLEEMGKGVFTIKLGKLVFDSEIIVAEIEDEALLGLDILMKGKGGPADIRLSEGVIFLNGVTIPCIQIGQPDPVRKIRSADNFVIPPKTERIIDVFVDKFDTDDTTGPQDYLLEPTEVFVEEHTLVMASCLVDISNNVTNKIRLMNPFDHEVTGNQHTVVGTAEKVVNDPVTLFPTEDISEV